MNGDQPDQEFINAVRKHFKDSVPELDRDTLADLAALREQALARRPASLRQRLLVPAGAIALLCIALAAYEILSPRSYTRPYGPDEIELMSILEGLDTYEDIEFYEWLEDQGFII